MPGPIRNRFGIELKKGIKIGMRGKKQLIYQVCIVKVGRSIKSRKKSIAENGQKIH
jgi:hypothetical protein